MNTKISWWKLNEKLGIYILSKCLLPNYLLFTKWKIVTLQESNLEDATEQSDQYAHQ